MKENIHKHVKLILLLICLFIVQVFVGCNENYTPSKNSRLGTQSDITNYIADNFDEYKIRVKDESGYEGKIISEEKDGKEQRYIVFDIDSNTKVKFEVITSAIRITKELTPSKGKIEMLFDGMDEDSNVFITLKRNGSITSEYKANDLEHPLPSQKEKDECIDSQIKQNISTQELEDLSSKAHSIYNVFEEICNEHNENLNN